jgi:hypothetical protein
MKRVDSCQGFSLIELLVAQVLVMLTVLSVSGALIAAQRYGRSSANWMRAIALMVDAQETIRAGHGLEPLPEGDTHQRVVVTAIESNQPPLRRAEVTISWNDGRPHTWSIINVVPNME